VDRAGPTVLDDAALLCGSCLPSVTATSALPLYCNWAVSLLSYSGQLVARLPPVMTMDPWLRHALQARVVQAWPEALSEVDPGQDLGLDTDTDDPRCVQIGCHVRESDLPVGLVPAAADRWLRPACFRGQ